MSAEFPNDNPALHRGAIWFNAETVGPPVADHVSFVDHDERAADTEPTPEVPMVIESGVVLADDHNPVAVGDDHNQGVVVARCDGEEEEVAVVVVEELPPLDDEAVVEVAANDIGPEESMAVPTGPDDPFTALVCAMADVAIGAGSPFVASLLPGLLMDGRLESGLSAEALAAMRAAGMLDESGMVTDELVRITKAWRAILCGTSDDLSTCGTMMLDEWAADLLARLFGATDRAAFLRRALRDRGVAAFGLIEAA